MRKKQLSYLISIGIKTAGEAGKYTKLTYNTIKHK